MDNCIENSNIQLKRKRQEEEKEEEEEFEFFLLVLTFIVAAIGAWNRSKFLQREPSIFRVGDMYHHQRLWMRALEQDSTCIEQLRINTIGFKKLCKVLCKRGGLVATQNVTIEETVALFLHILAHNLRNNTIKAIFGRSGETISRQFHIVLRAVIKIGKDYIKPHIPILDDRDVEKWKWFQGALGALDGTYVALTVPLEDQPRYRNRKAVISTNVLGVCDPNLKFTYVLPGWEGSAADSRVLRDALQRCHGLKVPSNKYYLVDAGYANATGFLAPYRVTRYHLKPWRGNTPTNHKELFNLRHSSARNVIERTFGLLKKRWAILRTTGFYDMKTQVRIINACCVLHNFIRDEMSELELLNVVDQELENASMVENEDVSEDIVATVTTSNEWTKF